MKRSSQLHLPVRTAYPLSTYPRESAKANARSAHIHAQRIHIALWQILRRWRHTYAGPPSSPALLLLTQLSTRLERDQSSDNPRAPLNPLCLASPLRATEAAASLRARYIRALLFPSALFFFSSFRSTALLLLLRCIDPPNFLSRQFSPQTFQLCFRQHFVI